MKLVLSTVRFRKLAISRSEDRLQWVFDRQNASSLEIVGLLALNIASGQAITSFQKQ